MGRFCVAATRDEGESIKVKHLRRHVEQHGATEGDQEYFYGVVDGFCGGLWNELFMDRFSAERAAATLEGTVVVVACRIMEMDDGEFLVPPTLEERVEAREREQVELGEAVEDARGRLEDALSRKPPA
jgi:hypothetical protein